MSENPSRPPSNDSPAWGASALITAVIAALVLIVVLVQRFFQSLTDRLPTTPSSPLENIDPVSGHDPQDPAQTMLPNTPTITVHEYNPAYDYHIESPPWSRYTKIMAAVIVIFLVVLLAQRFQSLIAQLVIAAIVAYILNPIINFVDRRTKVTRGTVLIIIYLLLAVGAISAFTSLGIAAFQQADNLLREIPAFIEDLITQAEAFTIRTDPVTIGPFSIEPDQLPWNTIQEQLINLTEPLFSRGGQLVGQILTGTISVIGNLLFIFVLSIYIAYDIPKLGGYVGDFAQTPGYRKDAERIMQEFGRIWSSYLRGQIILGLSIGLVVWLGLGILGVQNSLALGLLSGLLEFIPIVGPVIGAGVAMIVAFFQPDHCQGIFQLFFEADMCPLANWQYMLIVLGLMFVIQQLENNVLVPRIVGEALDLHPLLVMLSVFMGGSLAGILGAILAAPVAASLKLIGIYVWRKMFDDYPFQQPDLLAPPAAPPTLQERLRLLLARTKRG